MAALLKIVDEHFSATPTRHRAVDLRLVSERVTPREIIRSRVDAEIAAVEATRQAHLVNATRSLLIQPDAAEARLNPLGRAQKRKPINPDAETARAVAAFDARRFIMLFDDRQIDDLDEYVTVRPDSEVVFLYITPLKGG